MKRLTTHVNGQSCRSGFRYTLEGEFCKIL